MNFNLVSYSAWEYFCFTLASSAWISFTFSCSLLLLSDCFFIPAAASPWLAGLRWTLWELRSCGAHMQHTQHKLHAGSQLSYDFMPKISFAFLSCATAHTKKVPKIFLMFFKQQKLCFYFSIGAHETRTERSFLVQKQLAHFDCDLIAAQLNLLSSIKNIFIWTFELQFINIHVLWAQNIIKKRASYLKFTGNGTWIIVDGPLAAIAIKNYSIYAWIWFEMTFHCLSPHFTFSNHLFIIIIISSSATSSLYMLLCGVYAQAETEWLSFQQRRCWALSVSLTCSCCCRCVLCAEDGEKATENRKEKRILE